MTAKERAFVEAYISDVTRNQTAAALRAGYSAKSARSYASRLMDKPEIKAEIEERLKELHRVHTAEADEVVEFLTSVMRGEEVDNIPISVGRGEQEMTEAAPSAGDRIKAAELLGKYYAIFTEKAEIKSEGGVIVLPEVAE
ncbi:MAG: terminase small subunit [Firmicutes bacterium]|nr:terminase small subunit [Bacillota bacterium]